MDDETLDKLLAEVHRDYAELAPSGRCKCQSVVNVCHGRSNGGNLWKRVTSISLVCVRNMYSAQNQFPANTQTERMVDRNGETCGRNHWN